MLSHDMSPADIFWDAIRQGWVTKSGNALIRTGAAESIGIENPGISLATAVEGLLPESRLFRTYPLGDCNQAAHLTTPGLAAWCCALRTGAPLFTE